MHRLLLILNTLKYLKYSQIFYRVLRKTISPSRLVFASNFKGIEDEWLTIHINKPSLITESTVCFLNKTGNIETESDWNNPSFSKLWLYNLHYFDHLSCEASFTDSSLSEFWIERWVQDNQNSKGNGWEAYPISLRVVNWLKHHLSTPILSPNHLDSLGQQVFVLNQILEKDILANHYFVNAKALLFAGVCLDNKYSSKWKNKAVKILTQEINEQILEDGGNYELSPMYHDIMLVDLLDICNLIKAYPSQFTIPFERLIRGKIKSMVHWREVMMHPDGKIAFFNDATFDIAPPTNIIRAYVENLNFDYQILPHMFNLSLEKSGYHCYRNNNISCIIDIANIGPDYQPGHAHADSLSFEMSFKKQRVFVNRGVSMYGSSIERHAQRSTSSHNCVVINEKNSSEVWGGFRVARRARVKSQIISDSHSLEIIAEHNGYSRLKGKPMHKRSFHVTNNSMVIEDEISGVFENAIAYFYIAPDATIGELSLDKLKIDMLDLPISIESSNPIEISESTYCQGYGLEVPTKCLKIVFEGPRNTLNIKVKGF